jgi:hypothetical protein
MATFRIQIGPPAASEQCGLLRNDGINQFRLNLGALDFNGCKKYGHFVLLWVFEELKYELLKPGWYWFTHSSTH